MSMESASANHSKNHRVANLLRIPYRAFPRGVDERCTISTCKIDRQRRNSICLKTSLPVLYAGARSARRSRPYSISRGLSPNGRSISFLQLQCRRGLVGAGGFSGGGSTMFAVAGERLF